MLVFLHVLFPCGLQVGAEAGAMSLRGLAKGGVYIAGGITPKLISRLQGAMPCLMMLHSDVGSHT